jgi:hypothetical protein
MSEERGFEVVDRRGARTAPAAQQQDTPETPDQAPADAGAVPAEPDASPEEPGYEPAAEQAEMPVAGILAMTIGLLNEAAWVNMGLVPNPLTGQVKQNLAEARRAIDVLADLVKWAEMDASPQEKRELQVMLSNLRLNFVQQQSRGGE